MKKLDCFTDNKESDLFYFREEETCFVSKQATEKFLTDIATKAMLCDDESFDLMSLKNEGCAISLMSRGYFDKKVVTDLEILRMAKELFSVIERSQISKLMDSNIDLDSLVINLSKDVDRMISIIESK